MAKRKKNVTIQARRRLFFLRPICLFLVFFLAVTFISNTIRLYKLNNEKDQKDIEYIKLQEESGYLRNEITKLNDPEYLAKYARENYSYSKDGELIIKIDKTEEDEVVDVKTDIVDNKLDIKNYFIIGGILFVIYITVTLVKRKDSD